MRKSQSELFKVVNQQAHAMTRLAFTETRDSLRAKALLMLEQGWPQDKIVEAIMKTNFRQILKP